MATVWIYLSKNYWNLFVMRNYEETTYVQVLHNEMNYEII